MTAIRRIFELSLGQMLWSRRSVFLAVLLRAGSFDPSRASARSWLLDGSLRRRQWP